MHVFNIKNFGDSKTLTNVYLSPWIWNNKKNELRSLKIISFPLNPYDIHIFNEFHEQHLKDWKE